MAFLLLLTLVKDGFSAVADTGEEFLISVNDAGEGLKNCKSTTYRFH
jgi:hypothetical protein